MERGHRRKVAIWKYCILSLKQHYQQSLVMIVNLQSPSLCFSRWRSRTVSQKETFIHLHYCTCHELSPSRLLILSIEPCKVWNVIRRVIFSFAGQVTLSELGSENWREHENDLHFEWKIYFWEEVEDILLKVLIQVDTTLGLGIIIIVRSSQN